MQTADASFLIGIDRGEGVPGRSRTARDAGNQIAISAALSTCRRSI